MQLGHDDFGGGHAFFLVHARRNAAAIVLDRNRSIGVELDQHQIAMPGQRLVDRIVRNFEHHVVQARAIVGVADIHAGPLAHGIEALQHLDAVGAIFILVRIGSAIAAGGVFTHRRTIGERVRKPKEKPFFSTRIWAFLLSIRQLKQSGKQGER
jgi:hypothetical protein